MPPLFLNSTEISNLYLDGTQASAGYLNGTKVFVPPISYDAQINATYTTTQTSSGLVGGGVTRHLSATHVISHCVAKATANDGTITNVAISPFGAMASNQLVGTTPWTAATEYATTAGNDTSTMSNFGLALDFDASLDWFSLKAGHTLGVSLWGGVGSFTHYYSLNGSPLSTSVAAGDLIFWSRQRAFGISEPQPTINGSTISGGLIHASSATGRSHVYVVTGAGTLAYTEVDGSDGTGIVLTVVRKAT